MKNLILVQLTLAIVFFASCSNATDQNYYGEEEYAPVSNQQYYPEGNQYQPQGNQANIQSGYGQGNMQTTNAGFQPTANNNGGGTKVINIPDMKTGRSMMTMTIPTNWNYTQTGVKGPNNISAADVGMQLNERGLTNVQQAVAETKKELQKEGIMVAKTYPLPAVAASRKRMDNQMWKAGQTQNNFEAIGFEGTKDGDPFAAILIVSNYNAQFSQQSMVEFSLFKSDRSVFEQGKIAYFNAHASLNYVPQYIAQWNQNEQQKIAGMQRSGAARLNNSQRNFEAQNSAMQGAFNSMNESSMSGYNSRSQSSAAGQSNYINQGVYGRSTMTGPNGNTYQVEGQAQQYWMNGNGEYIPTNDPNFNPNLNPNMNATDWQQMQPVQGGGGYYEGGF